MMRKLFLRLTAVMGIAAFAAGLFGCAKRPSEPLAPQIDAFSCDIPVPQTAQKLKIYESAGGTEIGRCDNAAKSDYSAFASALQNAGFSDYDKNEIDGNCFSSFVKDDIAVYLSWFARTGTLRVIAEPKGELPPLKDPYEEKCDTLLTGMKGETVVAAEGMGYIVRLADGSFVIIDGGMGDPDHVDSDKLMGILNAQKPADAEKPVIAAWIFTHLHGDHIGVFNCFSLDHHDDVTIERFYFNFPTEEQTAASDSPYMLDDTIYRYTQFKKNLSDFYADVPVVKPHSGCRFAVRNALFEVLYAYDDLYPKTILNGGMNECSMLFKMTVAGQTVLWTGDFAFNAADLVLSEYTDALHADFLQLAHHGINGTVALYSAVDPTYALLPVWEGGLSEMLGKDQNRWLTDSENMKQLIATCCGTWTIRLPYDPVPGTFERIPTDETVYPAYPALLGE